MRVPRIGNVSSIINTESYVKKLDKPAYLLGVYYDGMSAKAVLEFVDEEGSSLILLHDPTGHKPYFLTDVPADEIVSNKKITGHRGFDHVEKVRKTDPLTGKEVVMTKIVTKDPLSVAKLREAVPKAWEAKIKYHDNYVFDNGLIPGMRYIQRNGRLEILLPKVSEETRRKVLEIFRHEAEETRRLALEWTPLFEEKPPPARRLAIDIEVYTPFRGRVPHPKRAEYPVTSIAMVGSDGYKRIILLARRHEWGDTPPEYPADAIVEFYDSEEALILETFRVMNTYPVVLTFNGDNFDLQYLYHRALKLGIPRWLIPFKIQEDAVRITTSIHLDLYRFFENRAIQVYAFGARYQEFTLDAVASALLKVSKIAVEGNLGELPYGRLIAYNYRDAELTLSLTTFDNNIVWQLMVLLARISKTSIEDICRKTISKWIQNQFYWEHRQRGYLIPEPEDIKKMKGARSLTEATIEGKKYAGALVIEPPMGVFFRVTVLDVASLYPSIIKKYNLSYETVDPVECKRKIHAVDETGRRIHDICIDKPGLIAQVIGLLRDFRVGIYKKKSKDKTLSPEERSWYDVVQRAMKVFINASYGVLGAVNFPLYAPAVAESVTALGRRSLYTILSKGAEIGLKILYGDTDSIFLWDPTEEQLEGLQEWVSRNLNLEIEVDKVFEYVLFTGLKKNYIGVYEDGGIEIKGLVAKKRNVPEFLKDLFEEIIEKFRSARTPRDFYEIKEWLNREIRTLYRQLRHKQLMLDRLAFKTGLTKPLEEYKKNRPQHVKAAMQLAAYGVNVMPGDIIVYVKVKTKEGVKAIQLAKLYEVDPDKYIEQIRSALEQLLVALGIEWDDIVGMNRLMSFMEAA